MRIIYYTHTDYQDIITVQADFLTEYPSTLLINSNDLHLDHLYVKFEQVIFYDDSLSYAQKLYNCISIINDDHFVLVHDMDIIIDIDKFAIDKLENFMSVNNVHRIYLLHFDGILSDRSNKFDLKSLQQIQDTESCETFLYSMVEPNSIASGYGVNPSLCNREAMLQIWKNFPHKTYRNIEELEVGKYCLENYNFYIFITKKPIKAGYFSVLNFFKFIHITHGGRLLSPNGAWSNDDLDLDIKEFYVQNIYTKYKFNR